MRPLRGLMRSVAAIVLAFLCAVPANTAGQSSGTGSGSEHSNSVSSAAAQQREEQFRYTNRLIHSNSPYLLLYAHNPVDWYPWVSEAFEKARRENKPKSTARNAPTLTASTSPTSKPSRAAPGGRSMCF
jgi:hypothetical protein